MYTSHVRTASERSQRCIAAYTLTHWRDPIGMLIHSNAACTTQGPNDINCDLDHELEEDWHITKVSMAVIRSLKAIA